MRLAERTERSRIKKQSGANAASRLRPEAVQKMVMGQAKQRGTQQERETQARARVESLKPASIVCNHCKEEITEVHTMDTRGVQGIDGAFAGICSCGHTTWAVAGGPEATAALAASMQETTGQRPIMGSMPRPTKPGLHAFINETRQESVLLTSVPCADCTAIISLNPEGDQVLTEPVRHGMQSGECANCGALHMIVSASTKADCIALEPVFAEMKRTFEREFCFAGTSTT
jgi:hypothetical protein